MKLNPAISRELWKLPPWVFKQRMFCMQLRSQIITECPWLPGPRSPRCLCRLKLGFQRGKHSWISHFSMSLFYTPSAGQWNRLCYNWFKEGFQLWWCAGIFSLAVERVLAGGRGEGAHPSPRSPRSPHRSRSSSSCRREQRASTHPKGSLPTPTRLPQRFSWPVAWEPAVRCIRK